MPMRLIMILLAACALGRTAPLLPAQAPGEQLWRVLPPEDRSSPELDREYRRWMRLMKAGSPSDRLQRTREMIRAGRRHIPRLLRTLLRRNQVEQRFVLLALMELHDPRVLPTLCDLASRKVRGASAWAALALGRSEPRGADLERAESALIKLLDDGLSTQRPYACLALGRLGGPRSEQVLSRALRRSKVWRDEVATIIALGMGGWPGSDTLFKPWLETTSRDRQRRAATAALGLLGARQALPRLFRLARDEDVQVRRLALEGLAWLDLGPEHLSDLRATRALNDRNLDVAARAALLLGRIGGEEALARAVAFTRHRQPPLRVAGLAACLLLGGARAEAAIARRLDDRHRSVRRMAVLARIVLAARSGRRTSFALLARDGDALLRRAGVLAEVYVGGAEARDPLGDLLKGTPGRDVRELATGMLLALERHAPSARALARARLQVMLDQQGGSPSWNLLHSTGVLCQRLLGVENARSLGGGGDAPGGASGAERSAAAAARRIAAHAEDLRLHLETWPYLDRRPYSELPPVRL